MQQLVLKTIFKITSNSKYQSVVVLNEVVVMCVAVRRALFCLTPPTAMGRQKNKYEQISVCHFCGKHALANRYGTPKNKNEHISVGHFCGEHAMGAKNRKCSFFFEVCVFSWPPTEKTHFCRWPQKKTDLTPVFMLTKPCTKILMLPKILPTRFCFNFLREQNLVQNVKVHLWNLGFVEAHQKSILRGQGFLSTRGGWKGHAAFPHCQLARKQSQRQKSAVHEQRQEKTVKRSSTVEAVFKCDRFSVHPP